MNKQEIDDYIRKWASGNEDATMLTTTELAEAVGVAHQTILSWISRGRLQPIAKFAGAWIWPATIVDAVRRLKLRDDRRH